MTHSSLNPHPMAGGPTELFAKPNSTILLMSRLMSSTHAAFPSGGLSQWPSGRMRTGLSRGLYTGISLAAGRGNWLSFAVIWFDGESLGWTIRIKMDLWWWSAVFHPLDDRMTTSTGKWYWAGFDGWKVMTLHIAMQTECDRCSRHSSLQK